jgi:hypothetical protein
MAHDLPEQRVVGNLIELRTPDKKHVVYYPQRLAAMAIQQKQYSVFHTSDESGTAYIVALQDNGAHFRITGHPFHVIQVYGNIQWEERSISDKNGVFSYKIAPSLSALNTYFDALKRK